MVVSLAREENRSPVISRTKQGEKYRSFECSCLARPLFDTRARTHTHPHAHPKQTKNGMGMFSAATLVADGYQLNGVH